MESGVYGVVERQGLRAFRLPPRDRPTALDPDRLPYLRRANDAGARLLAAAQAAAAGPPPSLLASLNFGSNAGGGVDLMTGRLSTAPCSARGGGVSARSGAGSEGADGAVGNGGAGAGAHLLGPDLEEQRAQWEAEMKGVITSQVVSELKSERTVEYIRSLEAAVARYRVELNQVCVCVCAVCIM